MLEVQELLDMLAAQDIFPKDLTISDANAGVPNAKWIEDEFNGFYKDKLEEMGLGTWDARWDCDDFAYQYYAMMRWAHFMTKKSMAEGIAVGIVFFMSGARAEGGGGGGHAINLVVVGKEGERKIRFIEPQFAAHGQVAWLELSDAEKESVWAIHF